MSNKLCVFVLAPNGRRQTVRVTENTTILQILEEVCKKQGFNPEDYDLKHFNRVLDTNSTIRFSGLPNHAQLEMKSAQKVRKESDVTVSVQLENGSRVMGVFSPADTLWNVFNNTCSEELNASSNPVAIYMRSEVVGQEALSTTTLRSLGLTGGRALIRLVHRTPEQMHTQANVSAPLKRTHQADKEERKVEHRPSLEEPTPSVDVNMADVSVVPRDESEDIPMESVDESVGSEFASDDAIPMSPAITDTNHTFNNFVEEDSLSSISFASSTTASVSSSVSDQVDVNLENEIIYLGPRNAIVFNKASVERIQTEDLPDEFFELTVKEVGKLQKELHMKRLEFEVKDLKTGQFREREKSNKALSFLHFNPKCVIRIQFPDQTVLQGIFEPLETISDVMKFVQEYLEDSNTPFYLFTTPPKNILSPELKLMYAECVPSAVLHFGTQNMSPGTTYLKPEVLSRLSSPNAATLAACKSRGVIPRTQQSSSYVGQTDTSGNPNSTSQPRPSTSHSNNVNRTSSQSLFKGGKNVPKWFKPFK